VVIHVIAERATLEGPRPHTGGQIGRLGTPSHYIETQTGWGVKKLVRTARRYRTVKIKAARQILIAADPLPADLRDALITIRADSAH
jgi:hypothetical protein